MIVFGMNMLHRAVRPGSEKARIWQICDERYARTGLLPSGRGVVDLYVAENGNQGTGFTQYSHWKKEFQARLKSEAADVAIAADVTPGRVAFRPITISADGHLLLPADMRRAMMLDADGRVTASVVDGELRVMSPLVALHQLQRRTRELAPKAGLVSEELIAERRAEAKAE